MMFLLYSIATDGEAKVLSNGQPVALDGTSGPFAAYVAREAKGACPLTWHVYGFQLVKELGGEPHKQHLVFREAEELADQYLVQGAHGYSYGACTLVGSSLQYLCEQKNSPSGEIKRGLRPSPEAACEFVHLNGGVEAGDWAGRVVDFTVVAKKWPDAYAFLKAKLGMP